MNRSLRFLHAIILVGVWMAIGWVARLEANSYLLVGLPLLLVFQRAVRKEPVCRLWVRDSAQFRLNRVGLTLGILLAIWPAVNLIGNIGSAPWPLRLWNIGSVLGAFAAGFAFQHFNRATMRALAVCLATAGIIGCTLMIGTALGQKHTLAIPLEQILYGAGQFFLYLPVCFVLEEVVFRGAVDAHVHHPGEGSSWLSAAGVSSLWGVWHLPILPVASPMELLALAIAMIVIHSAIGVFLSFSWRRTGNLAVPAMVHALIDAVRNAFLA